MSKKIQVAGYSESTDAQKNGVEYYVDGFGTVLIRRGGLADWQKALKEAREEVLGQNFSYNYIDPKQEEEVVAKACADYLVAGFKDDCVDICGQAIANTVSNRKAVLENPENYALVLELVDASMRGEYFLIERINEEIAKIKKS